MNIWLTNNSHHVNIANRWHQLAINNYTLHGYPIDFVLTYCIAAAPDPAWCANSSIETQAT